MDLLAKRSFIRMQKDIVRMLQYEGGTISHFSKSYIHLNAISIRFFIDFIALPVTSYLNMHLFYLFSVVVRVYFIAFSDLFHVRYRA